MKNSTIYMSVPKESKGFLSTRIIILQVLQINPNVQKHFLRPTSCSGRLLVDLNGQTLLDLYLFPQGCHTAIAF